MRKAVFSRKYCVIPGRSKELMIKTAIGIGSFSRGIALRKVSALVRGTRGLIPSVTGTR